MQFIQSIAEPWSSFRFLSAIAILVEAVALGSALHALRHVRTSQATVAWVVGLIALPWLTLPLYWMFARRRFAGYREAIRGVEQSHRASVAAVRRELMTEMNARTTSQMTPLQQVADVLDTPICVGNDLTLLVDGEAFYDSLIEQIRSAESYVYAEFYIIRDDGVGNRFATALIEQASKGVVVRLLYDEVGCLRLSHAYLNRLRHAGVDVRAFNTRQGWLNRFQINFRNHRKLLVVDGKTTIVGGLNIGDEYLGTQPRSRVRRTADRLAKKLQRDQHDGQDQENQVAAVHAVTNAAAPCPWRDTALLAVGPIAQKVQAAFAGDYYWAARIDLPEAKWEHATNPPEPTHGRAVVCMTGPADLRPRATMMFVAAIASARHRIWISTPYLIPNEALMVALSMARARGVDVRLLIPTVADQWAVYLAGFYYERELTELDIPVYRYRHGVMHQKCVLVDDSLALIGSTNLDNRSLHLNFELMLALDDPDRVAEVAAMLERDFKRSTRSQPTDRPGRPILSRVGTAIARLFSPVL